MILIMNLHPKPPSLISKFQSLYCFWACRISLFLLCFCSFSLAQAQIINGVAAVCQGDSSILTANDGFQTYKWSNGSLAKTIKVGASGKYFITVTDSRAIPKVDSFAFTAYSLPDGSIVGSPFVCYGRTASLSVEGNFRSVQWSDGQRTSEIYVSKVGPYSVNVVDINGCTASGTIEVKDGSKSYNTLPDTVKICQGDSVALDATTAFARSYYWNTADTTAIIYAKDSARYNVIVSSGECVNYDTIHVIVLPAPKVDFGMDTTICKGDTLTLKAEKSPLYAYKWTDGSTKPQLKITKDGLYGVEVMFGKCRASDSITITYFNKDAGKIFDTLSCVSPFKLTPILRGVKTYKWLNGSADSSITVSKSSNYQVVMSNGKCVVSWFYNLGFKKKPSVSLGKDTLLCQDLRRAEILLKAGISDGTKYLWQDNSALPQYQVKTTGKYSVKASNECGEATDEIDVTIKNCYEIFVPTSFSPNNDGVNETFQVYPTQNIRKILRFNVFDRWGNLVYAANNFMQDDASKNAWDGTFNGKALTPNVFAYFIEMETTEGAVVMQKGDVTLMR
jgi:gliding motility-associated-like protein